jgi:hypothetical protein
MSRMWRRAPVNHCCGFCAKAIHQGDPAIFIKIPPVVREKVRCVECAGEKPPDDLPPLLTPGGIETSGFTKLVKSAPHRTRGALKQAVKEWMPYREPGEDDE